MRKKNMNKINLSGSWRATCLDIEKNDFKINKGSEYPINIPGDLHSALIKESIIPDPYYAKNELDILFISRGEWSIEREFNYKNDGRKAFLKLEKLDTICTLYINNVSVESFDNEHQIYYVDITKHLKNGINKILFIFHSSEKEAIERSKNLPYPIPCSLYPNGSPNRNLVRKTQCNAGWDWGPCIMTLGLYEPPVIFLTQEVLFKDFSVTLRKDEKEWFLDYEVYLFGLKKGKGEINVTLLGEEKTIKYKREKGDFTYSFTLSVPLESVKLWWPNGMGKQPLYETKVKVENIEKKRKIGFRTLKVKNEITYGGKELTVSINGVDVFLKGSNWIPLDALVSRMTKERYSNIIKDMTAANMNAIRVWGGGWYEKEEFYDACDKYGILIWHDLMFACSTYPALSWFLNSVEKELRDQIRRLKSRTSIALWCGNNEDLGALGWYEETIKNKERYLKDYEKLNNGTVERVVKEEDKTRIFWPSSPCAGPGDYSDNWHNDKNGDMHFWSVWHEGKDFDFYHSVKPRFCSEFGYQSFPSPYTVSTFCPKDEYSLLSPSMLHHQKNDRGNEIIITEFERLFKEPKKFEDGLYLSQVQQALAIETAVTYWRSLMPYCMGTLIWQLNDVWPVSSWSSIEYSGRWKPLHYAIKHFYAPLCPLLYKIDDKVYIKAINDTLSNKKVSITVTISDTSGNIIARREYREELLSKSVKEIETFTIERKDAFVFVSLDKEERFLLFGKPNESKIKKSGLSIKSIEEDKDSLVVTLSSPAPTFFALIDTPHLNTHFSDNYFGLLPGEEKKIRVKSKEKGLPLEKIKEDLVLWDSSKILC